MVIPADASNKYTFQDTEESKDFYPKIYNLLHIKSTRFHILAVAGFLKPFSYRR